MVLALPVVTIAIISGVSLVIVILVAIGIARCTCCSTEAKRKRKARKKRAGHDELDRFLTTDDDSGGEYTPNKVTEKKVPSKDVLNMYNAAFEDDEIYFVAESPAAPLPDIPEKESPEHSLPPEPDRISIGMDVLVEESVPVVEEEAPLSTTPTDSLKSYSVGAPTPRRLTPSHTPKPSPRHSPLFRHSPVPLARSETLETTEPFSTLETEPIPTTKTTLAIEPSLPVESVPPETKDSTVTSNTTVTTPAMIDIPLDSPRGSRDSLDNMGTISDDPLHESPYNRPPGRKNLTLGRLSRSTRRINSSFSEQATLKLSLQYIASVKCLKGNIIEMNGLNYDAENAPNQVNFHLRFFPGKKFHIATKYKPIFDKEGPLNLNLTFTMGPVFPEDLANNKLRVKLYGKKTQLITRSKCYGECAIHLEDMMGDSGVVQFVETLAQRTSSGAVSSDSDSLM